MSGTKPPVIHRVSALDLVVEAWTWPFAETRRAEIAAHFADKQREKPAMWNGRVLLGRNPVFAGDRFSASYFETDFASFLAWRDWGFPDPSVFNGFGMGALRCADGAFVLGEMGQHTSNAGRIYFPSGTPDLDDIRDGAVDISGSVERELEEETGLAPGEYESEPHWHCVYTGRAVAMIRMLRVDMPGEAVRDRIEANLALQRSAGIVRHPPRARRRTISPPQCRVLSRRSSRRSSLPSPDASNTLDIWSRYQCDRRQQQQKTQCTKNNPGRIPCRGAKLHAFSLGCLPQSRCWGWRLPPRLRKRKSRSA